MSYIVPKLYWTAAGTDAPVVDVEVAALADAGVMVVGADEAGVDVKRAPDAFIVADAEVGLEGVFHLLFGVEGDGEAVGLPVGDGGEDALAAGHTTS